MSLPPVVYQPRLRTAPPLVRKVIRGTRAFVSAMADEAGILVLAGVVMVARGVWAFGAVTFVASALVSLAFWGNAMPSDAWRATYAGILALALMVAARFVKNACIRYRSRTADY